MLIVKIDEEPSIPTILPRTLTYDCEIQRHECAFCKQKVLCSTLKKTPANNNAGFVVVGLAQGVKFQNIYPGTKL
jgi:hypothetical protein